MLLSLSTRILAKGCNQVKKKTDLFCDMIKPDQKPRMKVVILTSDYHISANIGLKAFLDHPGLKKHDIEIAGIVVADQFNLSPRALKRTAHYFRKLKFWFLSKQIITNIWKQVKMSIGRYFLWWKIREYYGLVEMAEKRGIPFIQVASVNSEESATFIKEMQPDMLVSCFLLEIVKNEILKLPKKGSINVHPGLMQKHRGTFSSFWAIIQKWHKSGATVHYMTEKIDEGEMIVQKSFFIYPTDTIHSLNKKAAKLGGRLLVKALINIKRNRTKGFYLKKLGRMFSVPSPKDIENFYAQGRQSISFKEFFRF